MCFENSEKVAINKVQPMINGEVVSCNNNKEDRDSGRGESRQNCLNSDGASSETSSAASDTAASDDQDDSDPGTQGNFDHILKE